MRTDKQREAQRKYYNQHKGRYRALRRRPEKLALRAAYGKKIREENKERAVQMFGDRCLDCDQQLPAGLYQFHHLEPALKEHQISELMTQKWSEKLSKELEKCIMVCPTCHLGRHHGCLRGAKVGY